MNPRFLWALALCFFSVLKGQAQGVPPHVIPVTIFYDANWQVTVKPQAAYTREGAMDTVKVAFRGVVKDFYANGNPLTQLTYGSFGKEGSFQFFYPNKQIEQQGQYLADKPAGIWKYYYPDGKPRQTIEYLPKNEFRVIDFYDSTGQQLVKNGTGSWFSTYSARNDVSRINVLVRGQWKDSVKVGEWVATDQTSQKVFVENFEAGRVKSGTAYEGALRKPSQYSGNENAKLPTLEFIEVAEYLRTSVSLVSRNDIKKYIFRRGHLSTEPMLDIYVGKLDQDPIFPGGEKKMHSFISRSFKMPKDAFQKGVQGWEIVSFVVSTTGELLDVQVLKSLSPSVDQEMIRMIKSMPEWTPGLVNGQPVNARYTFSYKITR